MFGALHRAGLANQPESSSRDDGLELRDVWVTSAVKCAPPDNRPSADEQTRCRPFLGLELDALTRLRVIVGLGGLGTMAVARHLDIRPRPRFGHGAEFPIDDRRRLLCCYHVSQQNTFTGRLTESMLDVIFGRARELARGR